MSEFRNKQSVNSSRTFGSSIDGFTRPRVNNRGPVNGRPLPGRNVSQPIQNRQLGDFSSSSENLTAFNRSRNIQAGASVEPSFVEPLLVSKKPDGKRRLFGLLPPKNPNSRWSRMSKKRKTVTVTSGILITILIIFSFLVLKGYININKVLRGGGGAAALNSNVDPSKLKGEGDGRVNILLLGRGGEGHEGADLTDTIIVASIDPIAKEAALLSIPRDLYVPVPESGSMKINSVFATGKEAALSELSSRGQSSDIKRHSDEAGFKLLEETIENNLGLPVHYRSIVDFSGFKQAIDTVGGISVNAPEAVAETLRIDGRNYLLNVQSGTQHMDGFKSLAYARSRYTSTRGDFDRAARQRVIILALKEEILSAGTFSNPAKISGLLDTLGTRVQTNFSMQDLTRLYELGKEIDQSKITSIGLADPPNDYVTTDNIGGLSVVVPRAGVSDFSEIKGYLRNALKDSFIRDENASIAVLNGTETTGLAGEKAKELKSFGYNITAVGNAPTKVYNKTVIVDLRSGSKKYTKNYLEKRFDVTSVGSLPDQTIFPGTADFVIILGSDQSRAQY